MHFCKHGTYVGDPYGPDYLCGYCESGTEPIPPRWAVAWVDGSTVNGPREFDTQDEAVEFSKDKDRPVIWTI